MSSFLDSFGKRQNPPPPPGQPETGFNFSDQEQERFNRLNAAFGSVFRDPRVSGTGALFGTTGSSFDFNRFQNDAAYRENIERLASQDLGKRKALDDLLDFFEQRPGGRQAFNPIDVGAIFNPLGERIDDQAEARLQFAQSEINKQQQGALQRTTEALAGTGLGRSGVAAQAVTQVAQAGASAAERAAFQIEAERLQAQTNLAFKRAQVEYGEELAARGWTQEQIRDAIGFDRTLFQMQFQTELQQSLQPDEGGFLDSLSDVVDIGAGITGIATGIGDLI